MSSAAVCDKDQDRDSERHAGHGEDELLGPGVGSVGPRGHLALLGERLCGVEDGKGRRQHGEDDERAAEVDTSEGELGHAYADLDFLE